MNSLGRNHAACARALLGYHRLVLRVRRRVRVERLADQARADLDQLLFDLDVDVGAREGEPGQARMSHVEAALLHPTLATVRRSIAALSPREPPARWDPALAAVQSLLRASVARLRTRRQPACFTAAHTAYPEDAA